MTACASVRPAHRTAVDYNRAFADSRNEILLLNVLRAAGREPLQFSTMGTATGSASGTSELSLPLNNLIGGGTNPFTVSPSLTMTETNPSLTIIPLSDREFTAGILRPISPEHLSYFLNQGWDAEFVLQLAVGGVRCPGGVVVLNRGNYKEDAYHSFLRMFSAAEENGTTIEQRTADAGKPTPLTMPSHEALPFLQNGVGAGRRVTDVTAEGSNAVVHIQAFRSYWVATDIDFTAVCGSPPPGVTPQRDASGNPFTLLGDVPSDHPLRAVASSNGSLQLRSVESMIYFLGETQRIWIDRELQRCAGRQVDDGRHPPFPTYGDYPPGTPHEARRALFRTRVTCNEGAVPLHAAVRTSFNGRYYYIPQLNGAADRDRTLKTLSFLSELIALQTSQSLIESSSPTIAISR
jgi:hypothetical protein